MSEKISRDKNDSEGKMSRRDFLKTTIANINYPISDKAKQQYENVDDLIDLLSTKLNKTGCKVKIINLLNYARHEKREEDVDLIIEIDSIRPIAKIRSGYGGGPIKTIDLDTGECITSADRYQQFKRELITRRNIHLNHEKRIKRYTECTMINQNS